MLTASILTDGGIVMRRIAISLVLAVFVSAAIIGRANAVTPSPSFAFQTVVFPNDTFTQLLGINLAKEIAGYHGMTTNKGFVLTLPSNFTDLNFPGSVQTQVIGINDVDRTVGFISTRWAPT